MWWFWDVQVIASGATREKSSAVCVYRCPNQDNLFLFDVFRKPPGPMLRLSVGLTGATADGLVTAYSAVDVEGVRRDSSVSHARSRPFRLKTMLMQDPLGRL